MPSNALDTTPQLVVVLFRPEAAKFCVRIQTIEPKKKRVRNPVKDAAWRKAWRERNRDRERAAAKAYRLRNLAKCRAVNKAWRERNRERLKAQRSAYEKARKERDPDRVKRWKLANPDRVRAHDAAQRDARKAWKKCNRDRNRVLVKAWGLRNPERLRELSKASHQKRRARKRGATVGRFPQGWWTKLCEQFYGYCFYCEEHFGRDRLTIDHMQPLARGGKHVLSNLVPACLPCNVRKGTKTLAEFLLEIGKAA